jgi:hypothetical protein
MPEASTIRAGQGVTVRMISLPRMVVRNSASLPGY